MSTEKKIYASGHFAHVLDASKIQQVVLNAVSQLSALDFDTVAFIGLSGAVVAPIIAYELEKELLMIRKQGGQDKSNSGQWIEGHHTAKRVVVVDDLISSGRTMSQVMYALRELQDTTSPDIKIVGLLLHRSYVDGDYGVKLHPPDTIPFIKMLDSEFLFDSPKTGRRSERLTAKPIC